MIENRNWIEIKQECAECPYFIRDEENKIMQCVRPYHRRNVPIDFDEKCLTKNPLVTRLLTNCCWIPHKRK